MMGFFKDHYFLDFMKSLRFVDRFQSITIQTSVLIKADDYQLT